MAFNDYVPINTELAGNPVNWVIVLLMILIAGFGISLVFGPAPLSSGDN